MSQEKFEEMVTFIHDFQIKGAKAYVERKEEELIDAQNRLQELKQDDSKARDLAKSILDLAAKIPA